MDINEYLEEQLKDRRFREEYEKLGPEYEFRNALIGARLQANLTQVQLAERMGLKQSAIARLESGRQMPTLTTLLKLTEVLGVDFTVTSNGKVTMKPHRAA